MNKLIARDMDPVHNKGVPFKSVEDKQMISLLVEELTETAESLQQTIYDYVDGVGSNSTKPIYEALADIIDMSHAIANKATRFSHVNEDGMSSLDIALRRSSANGFFTHNLVKA